jgi:hypothetical protein
MAGKNGVNLGNTFYGSDGIFVWPDNSGLDQVSYSVPLPNGVTSGSPPQFFAGLIAEGILDSATFYGFFSTLPADAVGKCPATNCTQPTAIARGQQAAQAFAQDQTAIYWMTPDFATFTFSVWKLAK